MNETIPSWDGDPTAFETFSTAARWYERSLKENERKLAASRIWQRLSGAAKSVVRHLDPGDFDDSNGLTKLLNILRESPLQKLPVPDSFSRLERWSQLRRGPQETIPQLIVREEDLFVELQQALKRARAERALPPTRTTAAGTSRPERDPSASPSGSPLAGGDQGEDDGVGFVAAPPMAANTTGFFEDELRGYRLLKASKLTSTERQHVLTLTKNATHFELIRRALRTLFSEEDSAHLGRGQKNVWWTQEEWHDDHDDYYDQPEHGAYFGDYGDNYYDSTWDEWQDDSTWYGDDWHTDGATDDASVQQSAHDEMDDVPEDLRGQVQEAYALSQEANKTLSQAKAAVAKVRAARGYYSPESASGKGMSPTSYKGSSGPCIICGKPDHHTSKCPDRFPAGSKGKGFGGKKSKGKGFGGKSFGKKGKGGKKGKFKNKSKGVNYSSGYPYVEDNVYDGYFVNSVALDVYVLSLENQEVSWRSPQKALVDTGATENVAGVASISRLLDMSGFPYKVVMNDRPTFRFGDGLSLKATSRVDLTTKALGLLKVYVLDGTGEQTPFLLGARDLYDRRSSIDYEALVLAWRDDLSRDWACPLVRLESGHLSIELGRPPRRYRRLPEPRGRGDDDGRDEPRDDDDDGGGEDGDNGPDDGGERPPKIIRRRAPGSVRGEGNNLTQALRSSAHAASHDEAIPGLNGENIRFPLRPPHHQSETSPSEEAPELSPVPTTPNTEDIEAADRRAEEECRKMYAVDRKAAKHGALPKRAPTPQTPFTPTEEEFPNEPEETHEETHEGEEQESEECNEPDDIIEDDEPKQTKDSHTVMMVSHVSRESDVWISEGDSCHVLDGLQPLRERLERLARALGSSQDVPRSSSPTVTGFRSPSDGMAMLGMPSTKAEVQSTCNMEQLHTVCPKIELCGEDWPSRSASQCWTGPSGPCGCFGGASDDLRRGPDQREGGPREDHGSPGSWIGDYWAGNNLYPCEGIPEAWQVADGTQGSTNADVSKGSVGATDCDDHLGGARVAGVDEQERYGWLDRDDRGGSSPSSIAQVDGQGKGETCGREAGAGGLRTRMSKMWQSLQKIRSGISSTWDCHGKHDNTALRLTLRTPLLRMSHDTSPRMGLWMLKMEGLMDFILWRSM